MSKCDLCTPSERICVKQQAMEEPSKFERYVYKNASVYHYMKISLVLANGNRNIPSADFKQLVIRGLKELYGEIGASIPFDLLKFDENELTGVLRVYNSGLVKLWSALTLLGSYQNEACAFRVTQVSPFLLALSGNSRELRFENQLTS
ncbi:ribonuclease P protein subunit p14 [Pimephales promelas]|uniref:ribonuclease P protein subunit p14 n=1 Tax=Pimephales promelas TaxID=90988 RepID=UPI00195598B9|nr:ribonuclease P protein subunit p14 [Pimephales promelas]XP_039547241.1 ribonuclease P protein subunit p14 [Pimephales promelas]